MVGAIVGSTKREPLVVGKPSEFMLANIADTYGLKRSQICMVGDRLDTDILFGKNGGLTTCLVLSGEYVCAHMCVYVCVCVYSLATHCCTQHGLARSVSRALCGSRANTCVYVCAFSCS